MAVPPRYMGKWDEFFTILGHCLHHWQGVEENLFDVFFLVSLYRYSPIPATIFQHIRAFDQKCALTDKIAHVTLKERPELDTWMDLLPKVTAAGKRRDKIVHYSITLDRAGDLIVRPPTINPALYVSPKAPNRKDKKQYMDVNELRAIKQEFADVSMALYRFALDLHGKRRLLLKSHAQDIVRMRALLTKRMSSQER